MMTTNAPVGSADLSARTSQKRNHKPSYDGSEETLLWFDSGSDRKGNGEGQGNNTNSRTCRQVRIELFSGVSFAKDKEDLRL